MKDKDQVGADVYIDDSPDNIRALRKAGHYAICFGNSTNADLLEPRANSWEEVYKLIMVRYRPKIASYKV